MYNKTEREKRIKSSHFVSIYLFSDFIRVRVSLSWGGWEMSCKTNISLGQITIQTPDRTSQLEQNKKSSVVN